MLPEVAMLQWARRLCWAYSGACRHEGLSQTRVVEGGWMGEGHGSGEYPRGYLTTGLGCPGCSRSPLLSATTLTEEELARLAQKVGRAAAGQRVAVGALGPARAGRSSVPTHSPSRAVR